MAHGIPAHRLRVTAFGESDLLEEEETAELRQLNRRVTFRVVRILDGDEQSLPDLPHDLACESPGEAGQ